MLGGHVAVVVVFGVAEDVVCTVVVGVLEHEIFIFIIGLLARVFVINDEHQLLANNRIAGFGGAKHPVSV